MIPTKITFRLKHDEAKQLYYDARELNMSPHMRARDMVIEHLTLSKIEVDIQLMAQTMDDLNHTQTVMNHELQGIKTGLIDALAVLIAKQEGVSSTQAQEWLRDHFSTESRPSGRR